MITTSVIVCTYNGELYIEEQLRSILNQTILPNEIILVDDISNDSTVEVARRVLSEYSVDFKIIINDTNLGVTKNFEKACMCVSKEIVFFSDQDDIWLENKIEICIKKFTEDSKLNLLFTNALLVNEKCESLNRTMWDQIGYKPRNFSQKKYFNNIIKGNFVTGATMSCRMSFIKQAIPFPKVLFHDEWLALMAKSTGNVMSINENLIKYRQHSNNVVGATSISMKRKIDIYFNNFKKICGIREKKFNRFKSCLEKKMYTNYYFKKMNKCFNFWNDMISLEHKNFIVGHLIIFKNLINLNYFKYTSGLRVYCRDVVCQFIKK